MLRSPVYIGYMYVQPRCKKVNTTMYVHKGGVSNAYNDVILFIDSQRAGSQRRKQRRVHWEATD